MHASILSNETEPTYVNQAMKQAEWRVAMSTEFNALHKNGTWTLVLSTPSMNVLPYKWVYRIKRKSDGSIECYKARLVANELHQQARVDYSETFSPVIMHTTIRLILAIAVQYHWPIRQLDVQNVFLNGYVSKEVYMK